ncbi:MAG: Fur family transcriptional regulator [Leptonema sp. (in: bacteria)]
MNFKDIKDNELEKKQKNQKNQTIKYKLSKREIADLLRSKGINPTNQRIEIAHFMYQKPQHLSAEEILNYLNKEYEKVSQATVYNTLKLFVEKNIIRELIFSSDRIYYDSNTTNHHHFLDIDTGEIYDIPVCLISTPKLHNNELGNIEVEEISILIKGRFKKKFKTNEEVNTKYLEDPLNNHQSIRKNANGEL